MWTKRNLLGIEELTADEIVNVLDHAERWFERKPGPRAPKWAGHTVVHAFFEASTRTRVSFELATERLGARAVLVGASGTSVAKGETLLDTVKNLEAMGVSAFVVRHANSGATSMLARHVRCPVVNAGDGAHEHPTQALLDAFTIRRDKGKLEGLVVAICGDITHSRVARSNALLLGKLGAHVRLTGPRTMIPRHAETLGPTVSVAPTLDEAVSGADVVMMLRIQSERFAEAGVASPMSTNRDYARAFGLSEARLARAKPDALVMHPGPINRGVEIASSVADGPRSVVLAQVEAGVAVRTAVLDLVLGTQRS